MSSIKLHTSSKILDFVLSVGRCLFITPPRLNATVANYTFRKEKKYFEWYFEKRILIFFIYFFFFLHVTFTMCPTGIWLTSIYSLQLFVFILVDLTFGRCKQTQLPMARLHCCIKLISFFDKHAT